MSTAQRRKPAAKRAPAWIKTVNPKAFASLDAGPAHEETMIHVYWSGLNDARDVREGGMGHRLMRDKVVASLGLDHCPDPGFTETEMHAITYAAKMAALKCIRARECGKNYAEGAHCARVQNHKGKCSQLARVHGRVDE